MKRHLTLLILLALASAASGQEVSPTLRSVFKISPQHFTQRQLKVGFERFNKTYTHSFSIYLNALLNSQEITGYSGGYNGLGGEFQYRKYVVPLTEHTSKKGNVFFRGIYVSGYLQGAHYSGNQAGVYYKHDPTTGTNVRTAYDYKDDIGNWGGGFTLGVQQTIWRKIFIDAYVGGGVQFAHQITSGSVPDDPSYYYFLDPSGSGITALDYQGIMPKIGLQIGIGL
jgi:hypothetical protein